MSDAWNEYYSPEDIKKIQMIELQSLDVFIGICKKLDIRFFMYGGSLLGTVKYKGFVPWDDDLDVALLRDDYEKLIKEGQKYLPEKYEIQHPKITKKALYPYIKFRRTDTELVEYANHFVKINHGVYFDIYPIDNIPDNYVDYMKQKLEYDRWIRVFLIRQNHRIDKKLPFINRITKLSVRFFQSIIANMISLKYIMKRIDSISTRYNGKKTINQGNLSFPKAVNYFNGVDLVEAQFEGRKVFIPSGYEINLRNRYGDIDRLPPEDKRVGHKPYILNLGEKE